MKGFLYVLINPTIEGLVKIGKTARDPQSRAKELSAATGVPAPFVVAYDEYFNDCDKAEQFVHTRLEIKGYRVSNNKEFFKAPLKDVINAILEAQQLIGIGTYDNNDENMAVSPASASPNDAAWDDILKQADAHYHGFGDALEDYSEALHLYEQAAKLGSSLACLHAGWMYKAGEGCQKDIEKALRYFKEGANRGDILCYAEMAKLFSENGHIENARKCWKSFFNSDGLNDIGYQKVARAVEYLQFTKENKLGIDHRPILATFKEELISNLETKISGLYYDWESAQFYKEIISDLNNAI